MTRVIDVSLPLSDQLATFPGNPAIALRAVLRRAGGDETNVSELHVGTHSGTHVDAASHLRDGAAGVDVVPLDALVGEAWVVDRGPAADHINAPEMARLIPSGARRILLKSRNSSIWRSSPPSYPTDYVGLTADAARLIVEMGLRLVGVDGLSIEPYATPGRPVHRILLDAGIVIVEGLDLGSVAPGRYVLACLPLRVVGGDGGPARAVLLAGE